MTGRDDRIYEEAAALWRTLFDEPPPRRKDSGEMLEIIMRRLPEKPYDRLASPYLRPSQIVRPARAARH